MATYSTVDDLTNLPDVPKESAKTESKDNKLDMLMNLPNVNPRPLEVNEEAADSMIKSEAIKKDPTGAMKSVARGAALGVYDFLGSVAKLGATAVKAGLAGPAAADAVGGKIRDKFAGVVSDYHNSLKQQQAEDAAKYGSVLPGAGRFAGGMAAALPIGGAVGAGVKALGGAGVRGLGQVANTAAQGSVLGGLAGGGETQSGFSPQGAMIGGMIGGGMGAIGSSATKYLNRTKRLAEVQAQYPGMKVMMQDVDPGGTTRQIANKFFRSLRFLGNKNATQNQSQTFKPALENMIKRTGADISLSKPATANFDQAAKTAVNKMVTRLSEQEKALWKPMNEALPKIKVDQATRDALTSQAKAILKDYKPHLLIKHKKLLSDIMSKKELSAAQLKEFKSSIFEMNNKFASKVDSPAAKETFDAMKEFGRNMMAGLDDSVQKYNPNLLEPFAKARAFTESKHNMLLDAGPSLQKAIADQAKSYKFFDSLLKEGSPSMVANKLKPFTKQELVGIRASVLQKHVNDATRPDGFFDVNKFLKGTSAEKNIDIIMGDTYNSLKGIQKYMSSVLAKQKDIYKGAQTLESFGLVGGGVAGMMGGEVGVGAVAAPIISTKIMSLLATHSPVKSLLIKLGAAKPGSKLTPYLIKKIQNASIKAGVVALPQTNGDVILTKQDKE